ncbi:hypothetical protein CNECB9_2420009 [Cupriavidus necator]|uniref:Uncharacterized protein n=1 Tax=Cupriavidus necator TaxID=106590 RepID=A0A1K0JKC8_CUPNE|nr:hypothetical protein CNECB9_2420009 [Cupriavidus necator]
MGDDALRVMKAVMQNGGNAAGITSRTIVALARMLRAHPPLSGFTGYTPWGPGEHGDHLRRFLIHQAFNDEPQLADFALQQAPYRDVAIETSRVLNRVIIQSNGEKVFLSGASGNIFIIGRFEGTELGISSCYWAPDIESKLRGARSNICWEVRR